MKTYEIARVNAHLLRSPQQAIDQCEQALHRQIGEAAALAAGASGAVLLLSGPSGSGKTTAAHMLAEALARCGRPGRPLPMDDYFLSHSAGPMPVDELGLVDFESPDRLDRPLLRRHLDCLRARRAIEVPSFDFSRQERTGHTRAFALRPGECAVVEGIHALNPDVTGGEDAGLYVDAGLSFRAPCGALLTPDRLRLLRRLSRDRVSRGRSTEDTLALFASVSRGERKYILPYRGRALAEIRTGMAYELGLYRTLVLPHLPDGGPHAALCDELRYFLQQALPLPPSAVPPHSLLREFIGQAGL